MRLSLRRLGVLVGAFVLAYDAGASRAQSTAAPAARKTSNSGGPMLVGPLTRPDLQTTPFSEWFSTRYASYKPDPVALAELRKGLAGVSIEAYFGTWCGDSRRQIPRLLRVLNDAGFDARRLTLTGLSDRPMEFKYAPDRAELKRRVHRTPTIVLVRGGRELGRIVENPEGSLEANLRGILRGEAKPPALGAEQRVHDLFLDTPRDSFETALHAARAEIVALQDPGSLWHYAEFDLLRNGHPAAAKAVLDLHLSLEPKSARGHALLAEALNELGRKSDALVAAEQALRLEPTNERATRLVNSLREKDGARK